MDLLAVVTLGAAALLAQAAASPAPPSPLASASVSADAATIIDSGSTNLSGGRVIVVPDGTATVMRGREASSTVRLPATMTKSLFADLRAAGPLDRLTGGQCMKSASFGSTQRIIWHGAQSPDLTCPGGTAEQKLAADAAAIIEQVHLGAPRLAPAQSQR